MGERVAAWCVGWWGVAVADIYVTAAAASVLLACPFTPTMIGEATPVGGISLESGAIPSAVAELRGDSAETDLHSQPVTRYRY